jgi:hypothetical protein
MKDRELLALAIALVLFSLAFHLLVPSQLLDPKGPEEVEPYTWGHFLGIAGGLFLLFTLSYSLPKRSELGWKLAVDRHILLGIFAVALALLHTLRINRPPVLLSGALLTLLVLGFLGRTISSRVPRNFLQPAVFSLSLGGEEQEIREVLWRIKEERKGLIEALRGGFQEHEYSTHRLALWWKSPLTTLRGFRLQREERRGLETIRESLLKRYRQTHTEPRVLNSRAPAQGFDPLTGWWRPLHILLAYLVVLGLLAHVSVVFFFPQVAQWGTGEALEAVRGLLGGI